jgi:hypothetical protein
MRKAILASAFTTVSIAALAGFSMPAQAQQPAQQQAVLCGLRDDMGKMLDQRFGEQPQAGGIVGDRIVELLVSQTGSWTKADRVKLESTL